MHHADEQATGGPRRYLPVEVWRRRRHMGRTATYEALRRSEIPHVRVGRRILIPEDALDLVLAARGVDRTTAA